MLLSHTNKKMFSIDPRVLVEKQLNRQNKKPRRSCAQVQDEVKDTRRFCSSARSLLLPMLRGRDERQLDNFQQHLYTSRQLLCADCACVQSTNVLFISI